MATTRTANAHWEGSLMEGAGQVTLESSGLGTYDVSWAARAEEPNGKTSPEELIAAAHSTCFSMALSNGLAKARPHRRDARHQGRRDVPARHGHHRHPPDRRGVGAGPIAPRTSPPPPRTPRRTARSARRSPAPRSPWTPPWPDRRRLQRRGSAT